MSKINELIQTLCPDGVEYKKLGEVATISRGNGFQKKISQKKADHVFIMVRFLRIILKLELLQVKH